MSYTDLSLLGCHWPKGVHQCPFLHFQVSCGRPCKRQDGQNSASQTDAEERAQLCETHQKRGVFRSLQDLKDAIHCFLDDTNANSKPFTIGEGLARVDLCGSTSCPPRSLVLVSAA
jgi:hypothetical protein